jgi:hypothetical protein
MAQVGSSLGKKVIPQQVNLYPRAAPNISRSGGVEQGKSRILTLPPAKECLQDLSAKRRPSGTPNPEPRKKVKTCVIKLS